MRCLERSQTAPAYGQPAALLSGPRRTTRRTGDLRDVKADVDYFHINSIDLDTDGNLLVSARNTWAVYKVDRATGAVLWRLGGKRRSFHMGTGTNFEWQHDARRRADGSISLYDDGSAPQEEPHARGLVLQLDEAKTTSRHHLWTRTDTGSEPPGLVISPYARQGYVDHQVLSFDAYDKFIEDAFLNSQRIDPRSDGRADPRPGVRESAAALGNTRGAGRPSGCPSNPAPQSQSTDLLVRSSGRLLSVLSNESAQERSSRT